MNKTIQQEVLKNDGFTVITKERIFTEEELKTESDRIASWLCQAGVKRGSRIVLQMSRSFAFITALTGVFKAGAAVVILSKDTPENRYHFIIDDLQPALIITDEKYEEIRKGAGNPYDSSGVLMAEESDEALLIYTSGSTGIPKGVIHTQASLLKIVSDVQEHFGDALSDTGTAIALTDPSFLSFFVFEYGPCLTGRKKMRLLSEYEINSADELGEALKGEDRHVIFMTPSRYRAMTEPEAVKDGLRNGGLLALAGEKMPADLEEEVKKEYSDQLLILDFYGSTECGLVSARNIRNHSCEIFSEYIIRQDPNMEEGIGELCVKDERIFSGYTKSGLKQVITIEGVPYYPIGDIVEYSSEKGLIIHSRNDRMIKYNGLRIELDEISEVLKKCEGVSDAAVVCSKTYNRIAAWYSGPEEVSERALREEMARHLPYYMLPHVFHYASELPLNEHGKIDYQRIREEFDAAYEKNRQTGAAGTKAAGTKAPEDLTPKERILYEEIAKLIGSDYSMDRSCMELGIDSLMGLTLISRLGERSLNVSLKDIILSGSVRELAACMKEKEDMETVRPEDEAVTMKSVPVTNGYHQFLISAEKAGNDMMAMWIEEAFIGRVRYTKESFEERIRKLTKRHPVLGCEFVSAPDGQFIQEFGKVVPHISYYDLTGVKEEEIRDRIAAYEKDDLRSLEEREGKRECAFACFVLDDERCAIHIRISHTISDGMSQQILISELLSDTLPEEDDAFFRYLQWRMDERSREDALAFFKNYVKDADYAYAKPLIENAPGMPDLQGMAGMPGMPEMPGNPGAPDLQGMPDMSGNAGAPRMAGMPEMSSMPQMSGIPLMSMGNSIVEKVPLGKIRDLQGITPFVHALYRYANALIETFDSEKIVFYITSSGRNIPVKGMDQVVGDVSYRMPVVIEKGQSIGQFMEGVYEAENHLCITPEELWMAIFGEEKDPVNFPILVSEVFPDYTEGRLLQRLSGRELDTLGVNAYFLEEDGEMYVQVSYNPAIKDGTVYEKFIDCLGRE